MTGTERPILRCDRICVGTFSDLFFGMLMGRVKLCELYQGAIPMGLRIE